MMPKTMGPIIRLKTELETKRQKAEQEAKGRGRGPHDPTAKSAQTRKKG